MADTAAPGQPGSAVQVVPARYYKSAVTLVIAMMTVISVRMHEIVPGAHLVKPVFTLTIACFVVMMLNTSPVVRAAAFSDGQSKRILMYMGFIALTAPFAMWVGAAFGTAKALLPPALFFLAFLLCPPRRDVLDRLQFYFIVLVLFFSVYAQMFGKSWDGSRISAGGTYDSNDMASIMAMAFPMAAGLLMRSVPGRARWAAIAAVVALGLGVVATNSRGGLLALLAGVLVFAAGLKGERGFLLILALLVGGTALWYTAPQRWRTRMEGITNLEDDYNYTHESGRKAVWKRGRQYWRENPVIGVGAGNFPVAEGGYYASDDRRGKWSAAHNAYIQAFAELGTIGGGLFVAILVGAGRSAFPMWRAKPGARATPTRGPPPLYRPEFLASLAAFSAGAYFLSHAYFPPLFTVLGMIALAERVRQVEAAGQALSADAVPAESAPRVVGQRGGLAGFGPHRAAFSLTRGGLK